MAEGREAYGDAGRRRRGLAVTWRDPVAALGLLTVLPVCRPDPKSAAFARATLFFPLAGLLMGLVLAGVNSMIAHRWPPWLDCVLLVGLWELLGRGEAIRAVAVGGRAGALAATACVVLKVTALQLAPDLRPVTLLFVPMLARWGIVVLATGARDAHAAGQKFNAAVGFREFACTSVFTCAAVFSVAEALGILVVVCTAAVTLALRLFLHRRGGVSWRRLLAGAAGIETLATVVFAAL